MTRDEAEAVILAFPGAERSTSYGQPSFKVDGKFLTRIRDEDASVVVQEVGFDEREMLMAADPATFHFTEHYRNYPIVLARLAGLDAAGLEGFIARRFRKVAKKAVLRAWETTRSS